MKENLRYPSRIKKQFSWLQQIALIEVPITCSYDSGGSCSNNVSNIHENTPFQQEIDTSIHHTIYKAINIQLQFVAKAAPASPINQF